MPDRQEQHQVVEAHDEDEVREGRGGLRVRPITGRRARHRIQHHGPDAGQPQFGGQHQAVRTASRDGHVIHCESLSPAY